jgi:predicted transcriptional regulator
MSDTPDIRPDARRLVEELPASATWDDLAYEVYVRQAIEQGVVDADAGRLIEHDVAMTRVRSRLRRALSRL